MTTTGLQTIKEHLEVMLDLTTGNIEKASKRRYKSDADEWDRGYSWGEADALKVEKIHLEMLLGLVKNEAEKTTESEFSSPNAKSAA